MTWENIMSGRGSSAQAFLHDMIKSTKSVSSYWHRHNVTLHHHFSSVAESLEYFHWRNDQYFNYIALMPVVGFDGKSVLDYGCGPGHDLVGFAEFSKPQRLVGLDVSLSSLNEAGARLQLHQADVEMRLVDEADSVLPYPDNSFDHIHSSGVLHHTRNPEVILAELVRILRPGGTMNLMVYNYDSLWLHLYVAYQRSIVEGLFPELDLRGQFAKSTDGEDCPIANCYKPHEWIEICESVGLAARFNGAAISMYEASLFPKRFDAVRDLRLRRESREFLCALTVDAHGLPLYQGHYAGVDACFHCVKP